MPAYRDRSLGLRVIGAVLLFKGALAAMFGPVELYCLYLFSEGGRFHYEGFGVGSLMFGSLAAQIAGYYLAAALLLPLGYGHIRLRRWAWALTVALLRAWVAVGVPLLCAFLFALFTAKPVSPAGALAATVAAGLSYLFAVLLLLRFYRGRNVALTFRDADPDPNWTDRVPVEVLTLCLLYLFHAIVLHVLILFNGLFPLLGGWATGLRGIMLLEVAILALVWLLWGTFRRSAWAWWAGLAYFGVMAVSWLVSLLGTTWPGLLEVLDFPPLEARALEGMPVEGWHLALLVEIPVVATLAYLIGAQRLFLRRLESSARVP